MHVLRDQESGLQELVAQHLRPVDVTQGHDVCRQGEEGDRMWICAEGDLLALQVHVSGWLGVCACGMHLSQCIIGNSPSNNDSLRYTMPQLCLTVCSTKQLLFIMCNSLADSLNKCVILPSCLAAPSGAAVSQRALHVRREHHPSRQPTRLQSTAMDGSHHGCGAAVGAQAHGPVAHHAHVSVCV